MDYGCSGHADAASVFNWFINSVSLIDTPASIITFASFAHETSAFYGPFGLWRRCIRKGRRFYEYITNGERVINFEIYCPTDSRWRCTVCQNNTIFISGYGYFDWSASTSVRKARGTNVEC